MFYYIAYILFVVATFWGENVQAQQLKSSIEREIVYAINEPGSPPYIYIDVTTNSHKGIALDFFKALRKKQPFELKIIDTSRARIEYLVLEGKADVFISSALWLKHTDKLTISQTLMSHRSFLYSLTAFEQPFLLSSLANKYICTRRGYVYPSLTQYFEQKQYIRVDSSTKSTMINMLVKGRCDYAVMNEFNAIAEMNSKDFCETTFHRTPVPIHEAPLAFVVSSRIADMLPAINQQIVEFQQSGQLASSIVRHAGSSKTSSHNSCQ